MPLTIEEILQGTEPGRRQSVGVMEVIPLVGEDDETFSPPDVEVSTSHYGTVNLRNTSDRTTFVPPGAGWVVKESAQDHAIGGGAIIPAKSGRSIETAMCIQSSQGGYISRAKHEMLILPATLRIKALAIRKRTGYDKLWSAIETFNHDLGARGGGHLEFFLNEYKKQLDQFVAEFELVPNQIGAIILINGHVVGIERSPSAAFWEILWNPLVRVCYGSLAVKVAREGKTSGINRVPLTLQEQSLAGLSRALLAADTRERKVTSDVVAEISEKSVALEAADEISKLTDGVQVAVSTAKAGKDFVGQIVTIDTEPKYASLCAKL